MSRFLVFLRHGQYDPDHGSLTVTGCEQAKHAARMLARTKFDTVWSSTLPRARETADIVAKQMQLPVSSIRRSGLFREGIYTKVEGYEIPADEQREDRERAEAAWKKLFRTSRVDRTELVVCHGNIIRYFVCQALRAPLPKWLRMTTNHCAVTRFVVRERNGSALVRLISYNETGHLPPKLVT